ncbi:MAG: ABC transporter substrate-binding protein [Sedimentisphaerales bacterium]|nr:ABC transporter substrate-binding protein [Sedimentisphaerales bacterium]
MNKWLLLLLLILCWMAAGFALLGSTEPRESPGATLPNDVQRIVSLAPNLTEILFALGLDEQVVGVAILSDYPPAAMKRPKIGTFWQPNIEAVIAAKPDLVVTLEFPQQKEAARQLRRLGCNCLTVNIETVSDLFEAIGRIAEATRKNVEADKLASDLRSRLDGVSASVAKYERPKVLWVIAREPLRVAGRDTFVNEIIELAGGENAIGRTVHKYPPIGSEQVIAGAADVIIEPAMGSKTVSEQQKEALRYWSRFKNVPAVANGRIYVISPDTVCRLGPRLPQGVETVARCLRPELFTD